MTGNRPVRGPNADYYQGYSRCIQEMKKDEQFQENLRTQINQAQGSLASPHFLVGIYLPDAWDVTLSLDPHFRPAHFPENDFFQEYRESDVWQASEIRLRPAAKNASISAIRVDTFTARG